MLDRRSETGWSSLENKEKKQQKESQFCLIEIIIKVPASQAGSTDARHKRTKSDKNTERIHVQTPVSQYIEILVAAVVFKDPSSVGICTHKVRQIRTWQENSSSAIAKNLFGIKKSWIRQPFPPSRQTNVVHFFVRFFCFFCFLLCAVLRATTHATFAFQFVVSHSRYGYRKRRLEQVSHASEKRSWRNTLM